MEEFSEPKIPEENDPDSAFMNKLTVQGMCSMTFYIFYEASKINTINSQNPKSHGRD